MRRSIAIDSSYAPAWSYLSSIIYDQIYRYVTLPMTQENIAMGMDAAKKAIALDPLSPLYPTQLAVQFLDMRQYDKALEQLKNALELDTHFASAYVYLSFTYVAEERFEEAVQAIEAAKQSFGRNPLVLGILGFIYAYMAIRFGW